jgi:anti-sigma B factor antagonist
MFGLRTDWADEHGCRLHIAGELDVGTAPELRQVIGDLMSGGVRTVVVDLAETDFLDSTGLAALLWAEHRLEAIGGSLAAVHPRDEVARVLAVAGADALVSAR